MTYLQASVYGMLQGLTEFLPVSSSGHLILLRWLTGWEDPGLAFDVALHLGTLAALGVYFYRDWRDLLLGTWRNPRGKEARLLFWLGTATLPAAAAGLAFESQAEALFRKPAAVASALILFGLLLELADRFSGKKKSLDEVRAGTALGIGAAQALAIFPGVSRSGVTLTAGLALGFSYDSSARFSFLLATPVILGAGVLKLRHLESPLSGPFLWALAASALTGLGAVHFFLNHLRRSGPRAYVAYRLALGLAVLVFCAFEG